MLLGTKLPSCVAVSLACPWPLPAPSGSSAHVCSSYGWLSAESPKRKTYIEDRLEMLRTVLLNAILPYITKTYDTD